MHSGSERKPQAQDLGLANQNIHPPSLSSPRGVQGRPVVRSPTIFIELLTKISSLLSARVVWLGEHKPGVSGYHCVAKFCLERKQS